MTPVPAQIVVAIVFGKVSVLVYAESSHLYFVFAGSEGQVFDNSTVAIGRHVLLIVEREDMLGISADGLHRVVLVMGGVVTLWPGGGPTRASLRRAGIGGYQVQLVDEEVKVGA